MSPTEKNKERVLAKVNEEYQDYINEVAQHAITNDELHDAGTHQSSIVEHLHALVHFTCGRGAHGLVAGEGRGSA